MKPLTLAIVLFLGGSLAAQTTWIVDAAARPGHHFTKIQAAVDAASPGDVILVREIAGYYTEGFAVDKGVTILGEPTFGIYGAYSVGVTTTVQIHDLPAGQTFVLANATVYIQVGDGITVSNSQGHVHLQDVDVRSDQLGYEGVQIDSSSNVTLTDCAVGEIFFPLNDDGFQRAIMATGSDVTVVGSSVAGADHGQTSVGGVPITVNAGFGIRASSSTVHVSRSDVRGGSGNATSTGRSAIDAQGSAITVAGLASDLIQAGSGNIPIPAIRADAGSTVVVDADVSLQSAGGFAPWGGGGQFTQRVVVSLDVGGGDLGGVITTDAASQANDIVTIVLSLPVPPTPLPPFGTQRIALANVFLVASAIQPASGVTADVVVVPNVGFLRGLTLGLQALSWDHVSGAVELSNVGVVTLH